MTFIIASRAYLLQKSRWGPCMRWDICGLVSGWEEREERGTMHVRLEEREKMGTMHVIGQVHVRTLAKLTTTFCLLNNGIRSPGLLSGHI
jgi:hypothetical protein